MSGYIFLGLLAFFTAAAIFRPWLGIVGYYSFVFLVPQWNWRWLIDYDTPMQKWIAGSLIIGFLINNFPGQKIAGVAKTALLGIILFFLLSLASSLQSINPDASSFWLSIVWKIVLIVLLTVKLIDTDQKRWTLLWVVCLSQGYNAFRITEDYLLIGYCRFVRKTDWAYLGSNQNSIIATVLAAISVTLLFYSNKLWQKITAFGIFALQAHEVMLMESRGCYLGLGASFLVAVYIAPKHGANKFFIVSTLIAGSILAGPPVVKEFQSIFEAQEERDDSAASRFDLWNAGFAITMDFPILGVGPHCGQYLVPKYAPAFQPLPNKALHNIFFEISTGSGLIALGTAMCFYLYPLLHCVKKLKEVRGTTHEPYFFLCIVGTIAFLVSNQFSSGVFLEASYFISAITCACLTAIKQPITLASSPKSDPRIMKAYRSINSLERTGQ